MSYPIVSLLFHIAQDVDDDDKSALKVVMHELGVSRDWSLGPPEFLEDLDPEGACSVGGRVALYSAHPPTMLPVEVDNRNLEEVEVLLEELRKLSAIRGLSIEFELGGTYVGSIEDGLLDRTLRAGLLEPWREHLGKHE